MILTAQCDECLAEASVRTGWDGLDRCNRCEMIAAKRELISEIEHLEKWLEDTHLKTLREKKLELEKLSERLRATDAVI